MTRRRRRRITTELVRPDFPVVPMLIFNFLLLATFVFFVRKSPDEVQFPIRFLPEGHLDEAHDYGFRVGDHAPTAFTVAVEGGPNGTVGSLTVREKNVPAADAAVGAGIDHYRVELKKRSAARNGRPGKLLLEIGDGIRYGTVIQLIDIAIVAGFEDVAFVLANEMTR